MYPGKFKRNAFYSFAVYPENLNQTSHDYGYDSSIHCRLHAYCSRTQNRNQ